MACSGACNAPGIRRNYENRKRSASLSSAGREQEVPALRGQEFGTLYRSKTDFRGGRLDAGHETGCLSALWTLMSWVDLPEAETLPQKLPMLVGCATRHPCPWSRLPGGESNRPPQAAAFSGSGCSWPPLKLYSFSLFRRVRMLIESIFAAWVRFPLQCLSAARI